MKKCLLIVTLLIFTSLFFREYGYAQCSICTKTASQLGEKPAKGMNSGILYLMFAPLAIAGFVGLRWWKREKAFLEQE